ncbi:MAG: LysR substrate-binding domain-containing protein [Nitrospira sp.]
MLEVSLSEGILPAVADGIGATILSELDVRSRLSGGELQLLDRYDPTPCHQVGLAYLTKQYRNLADEEFARLCQITMNSCSPIPSSWCRPRYERLRPASATCA